MLLEADEFALPALEAIRVQYRSKPDAQIIYQRGVETLNQARTLNGADNAFHVAALESFLADVLIGSGTDAATVSRAQRLADSALLRIQGVASVDLTVRKVAMHTALLSSIASKALGDLDSAFRTLQTSEAKLTKSLHANWIDSVPLRRQAILMLQKEEGFIDLANSASMYRQTHPSEYYASLKRLFEYLLNHRRIDIARQTMPALQHAYRRTADRLPLVAKVSFLKNTGHYLVLDGYPRKGVSVLTQALTGAVQFNLHGQARQLSRLIQESQGGVPNLETFRV